MTIISRTFTVGLVSAAAMLVNFGLSTAKAAAQTAYKTYDFTTTYNTNVTINPFKPELPDMVRATITGDTTDAPYGLNFFTSNTYGKVKTDPVTYITNTHFNSDASTFGLDGEQVLGDRYFGGPNELFGKANDSAEINPAAGTIKGGGTITIHGGTGIFQNATGEINFTEEDQLGPDPTAPSKGQAILKFSLRTPQAVPEPSTNTALIGIAVIGGSLLLRRRIGAFSSKSCRVR